MSSLSPKYGTFFLILSSTILSLLVLCTFSAPILVGYDLAAPPSGGDEYDYIDIGYNLSQENGFSVSREAPNFTTYRPPLYPLFIGNHFKFFGEDYQTLRIMQILVISLLVSILIIQVNERYGLISSVLMVSLIAIDPTVRFLGYPFLTEGFTLALSCLIVSVIFSDSKESTKAIMGGVVFGTLILLRTSFIIWIPMIFTVGVILAYWKALQWKTVLLTTLIPLLLVAPWLYRNSVLTAGRYPLGTQGTINLPIAYSKVNYKANGLWNSAFAKDMLRGFEAYPVGIQREVAQADAASTYFKEWREKNWEMIPSLMMKRIYSLLWRHTPQVQRIIFFLGLLAFCFLLYKKHTAALLIFPCIFQTCLVALTWNVGQGRFFVPMYPWLWGMIVVAIGLSMRSAMPACHDSDHGLQP